jgi:hypothetical protein
MLFTQKTKNLYLVACRRLNDYAQAAHDPHELREVSEEPEGVQRMLELSILRTQMTLDLQPLDAVYEPDFKNRQFLLEAGIDPRTWGRGGWLRRVATIATRRGV